MPWKPPDKTLTNAPVSNSCICDTLQSKNLLFEFKMKTQSTQQQAAKLRLLQRVNSYVIKKTKLSYQFEVDVLQNSFFVLQTIQ